MFCGGCALGVKKALKAIGISEDHMLEVDPTSADPTNRIGHAKIRFAKTEYKGMQTDCEVVKAIESHNPRLSVYWDAKVKKPCQ